MKFKLASDYEPRGDQPEAIAQLVRGINDGDRHQVLLGVTGSGKTFTMAKVIEQLNRPTIVLAHNKTLAAQLFHEFQLVFSRRTPSNISSATTIITSPKPTFRASDTYIEKESTINDELDKLRMSATRSLFERRDVIIVASVSCIYGIGSPEAYYGMMLHARKRASRSRAKPSCASSSKFSTSAPKILRRGTFRVRGDIIEIYPPYDDLAVRIELWGSQIEAIRKIDPLTGEIRSREGEIYPPADLSEDALRPARRTTRARHPEHLRRTRMVEARARAAGKNRRSAAHHAAHSCSTSK